MPLTDIFVFDVSGTNFVVARYDGEMLAYDEYARREDAEKAAESLAEKSLGVLLITPEEIKKNKQKRGSCLTAAPLIFSCVFL